MGDFPSETNVFSSGLPSLPSLMTPDGTWLSEFNPKLALQFKLKAFYIQWVQGPIHDTFHLSMGDSVGTGSESHWPFDQVNIRSQYGFWFCFWDNDLKLLYLVGGWPIPLKNMNVNWDDYSQLAGKINIMFQNTNQISIHHHSSCSPWFRLNHQIWCELQLHLRCFFLLLIIFPELLSLLALRLQLSPVRSGYNWVFLWDYIFHKWDYKEVSLVKGHKCAGWKLLKTVISICLLLSGVAISQMGWLTDL